MAAPLSLLPALLLLAGAAAAAAAADNPTSGGGSGASGTNAPPTVCNGAGCQPAPAKAQPLPIYGYPTPSPPSAPCPPPAVVCCGGAGGGATGQYTPQQPYYYAPPTGYVPYNSASPPARLLGRAAVTCHLMREEARQVGGVAGRGAADPDGEEARRSPAGRRRDRAWRGGAPAGRVVEEAGGVGRGGGRRGGARRIPTVWVAEEAVGVGRGGGRRRRSRRRPAAAWRFLYRRKKAAKS
ncbi:hypothetical protein GUJ93_ZPchr0010g10461 [Zizania palustris]|uniref:Uncharacterized protein n=1 Tax=Zizania palustris TaxID=103762 RepID=A0A8J6BPZ7_ZIZPA|nr:hypothetical protein GUJ93_ZPchr0010g10461 [Zizania palustris]